MSIGAMRHRGTRIWFVRNSVRIVFDSIGLLVLRVRRLLLSFTRAVWARIGGWMLQAREALHPIRKRTPTRMAVSDSRQHHQSHEIVGALPAYHSMTIIRKRTLWPWSCFGSCHHLPI